MLISMNKKAKSLAFSNNIGYCYLLLHILYVFHTSSNFFISDSSGDCLVVRLGVCWIDYRNCRLLLQEQGQHVSIVTSN